VRDHILKKKWVYKEHDENRYVSLCRHITSQGLPPPFFKTGKMLLGRDFDKMRKI
jgi:hypothetical protein